MYHHAYLLQNDGKFPVQIIFYHPPFVSKFFSPSLNHCTGPYGTFWYDSPSVVMKILAEGAALQAEMAFYTSKTKPFKIRRLSSHLRVI